MDVREKLVELLNEMQDSGIVETPAGFGFTKQYIENDKVASHLFDNGATVQEWIPVSEPPKEKGTYIVCTDKGGILLGHWYGKEWNVGGGAKKHLAYWMKKPQPPKGE